jgi:ADP-ribose diphosphatase
MAEPLEAFPELLSSRTVYEGKVVSLRVDEILLSDGRAVTREVVEHPGAVVVVAVDDEGRVPLVRQYRHAVKEYLLELPAGGLEPGELPQEAARRELREEVGVEAGTWRQLGYFFSSPGFANEKLHVFLAEDLRSAPAEPDDDEEIAVVRCRLSELYDRPELIQDAKSLAALLLLSKSAEARNFGTT